MLSVIIKLQSFKCFFQLLFPTISFVVGDKPN